MNTNKFKEELREVINRNNMESVADVPDLILADMICSILEAIGPHIKRTLDWHGCSSVCHPTPQPVPVSPQLICPRSNGCVESFDCEHGTKHSENRGCSQDFCERRTHVTITGCACIPVEAEKPVPVVVAGRRSSMSNADFERSCLCHIERLQHGLDDYDSAMMATFCEAIRMVREYSDNMQIQARPVPLVPDKPGWWLWSSFPSTIPFQPVRVYASSVNGKMIAVMPVSGACHYVDSYGTIEWGGPCEPPKGDV